MAVRAAPDQIYRAIAVAVDPAFYRAVYPGLGALGRDPVRHYVRLGWREGRDPAPWFSTDDYLEQNPDVAQAGLNPLYHYLTEGRAQGREILRSRDSAAYLVEHLAGVRDRGWAFDLDQMAPVGPMSAAPARRVSAQDRALVAAEFNEAFYLSANRDVAEAGLNPLDHFLRLGWREGRDPNEDFSTCDYLDADPDVAASGENPFVHYLREGRAEGRAARNTLGFRYPMIARLEPMAARMAKAERASAAAVLAPAAHLAHILAESVGEGLHLSFSHDDYVSNVGGVQSCVGREGEAMAGLGRDHLHLFPVEPWPMLRVAGERSALGVVWNGAHVGAFEVAAVIAALGGLRPGPRSFALHSLLGHAADEVLAILSAAGARSGAFWLHDFASLCAGYHLLRNEVADCGAPPPTSGACTVCVYGPHRARHLDEHGKLFEALELTVASPSASALATWKGAWSYPAKAELVLPHARLVEAGPMAPIRPGPLRVAFLGWASPLKGWPIFQELARKYADDPRYGFLHLGKHGQGGLAASFHEVAVSQESPMAMRDAVARLGIDVALIWPLCRETFSFTAHEAVAGGAAVVTWPDSGNVAAFVEETGHGLVLPGEAALHALFASGEALRLARSQRHPKLYDIVTSQMSADLTDRDRT